MELLESDDPKSELLKKSAQHRKELQQEVESISDRTQQVIVNSLVIGGSLALAYFLVNQFTGSKKKKFKVKANKIKYIKAPAANEVEVESVQPSSPGILTQVGTALASQASVLLLSLAKEQLVSFLQSQMEKKENK